MYMGWPHVITSSAGLREQGGIVLFDFLPLQCSIAILR